MPLAHDLALDQVTLKCAQHGACPFAAVANEADAAAREPLDRGDADLLLEASGHNLSIVQIDKERPAHFFSARRAAAMASLAFEYR